MKTPAIPMVLAGTALAASAAAVEPKNCNMNLTLHDAVEKGRGGRTYLEIELQIRDGEWQQSFLRGRTPRMNQGRHVGCIREGAIEKDKLTAKIEVLVKPDPWVGGGTMGGFNLAYWSNHNGIRQAGAGLAALHEKKSDGKVLENEALAIAEEAAWDNRGWLRDGRVLAVVALQKGVVPEFKVKGSGLDAQVALGGRTVRFMAGGLVVQ